MFAEIASFCANLRGKVVKYVGCAANAQSRLRFQFHRLPMSFKEGTWGSSINMALAQSGLYCVDNISSMELHC